MRRKDESKKDVIMNFVNAYYGQYTRAPAVRDIAKGTGIPVTTVHRYLGTMRDAGMLEYNGRRNISTERMSLEGTEHSMPVRGYVACGPGQEEEERIIEYIRMPESLIGCGDCFALIAKGESMTGAGILPGDYVFVERKEAEIGDIVVALLDGKNNLKVLGYDKKKKKYLLLSCNPDKETYADIPVDGELEIQGVAVCVAHKLGKALAY